MLSFLTWWWLSKSTVWLLDVTGRCYCVGAMDGTTFQLATKPKRVDAPDFKGRKEGYTLTGLLFLFNHRQKIRYYITVWTWVRAPERTIPNNPFNNTHHPHAGWYNDVGDFQRRWRLCGIAQLHSHSQWECWWTLFLYTQATELRSRSSHPSSRGWWAESTPSKQQSTGSSKRAASSIFVRV